MKNGIKPTRNQRKLLEKYNMDAHNWLIVKDTPEVMVCVHRFSDKTIRTLPKGD
jgi:hypothetical protein